MKIGNLNQVNTIDKQIAACLKAINEIDVWLEADEKGDAEDFWGFLSEHKDGSGRIADLTGCYVMKDVVLITRKLLVDKIRGCCQELAELGVEVSAEDLLV